MTGHCTHCRTEGIVWRYRLAMVGLRYLDRECADRLTAMGMDITPVTDADPRDLDRGYRARRVAGDRIRHCDFRRAVAA